MNSKIIYAAILALLLLAVFAHAVDYPFTPKANIDMQDNNITDADYIYTANLNVSGSTNMPVNWTMIENFPPCSSTGYAITCLDDSLTTTYFGLDGANFMEDFNAQSYALNNVSEINNVLWVEAGNASDINAMITAASDGYEVKIPEGEYTLTSAIILKNGIRLIGNDKRNTRIICDNVAGSCIKGISGTRLYEVSLENLDISGDNDANSIGLDMTNISTSSTNNLHIQEFEKGIYGNGLSYYNNYYNTQLNANDYNVYLESASNEHRFYGGTFNNANIWNTYIDTSNGIQFYGVSFEGTDQSIRFVGTSANVGFFGARFEVSGTSNITIDSTAYGISFMGGRSYGMTVYDSGTGNVFLMSGLGYDLGAGLTIDGDMVIGDNDLKISSTSNYLDSADNENLISHLGLESSTGTIAYDTSNIANDATIYNTTAHVAGKFGRALKFDGDGDYVKATHDTSYLTTNSTISIWYNLDTLVNYEVIFALYKNSTARFYCEYQSSRLSCYNDINNANSASLWYDGGYDLNRWYNLVVMYNDTGFTYYLDNEIIGTEDTSDGFDVLTDYDVYIGGYYDGAKSFNGMIDEFKFWNQTIDKGVINSESLFGGSTNDATGHLLPKTGGTITGDLESTGNITADNVFIKSDIYVHTDSSQSVASAGAWVNITFTHESDIKQGITHTYNDATNDTITVIDTGVYDFKFAGNFNDTSANPDDYVYLRVINNGVEINGSGISGHLATKDVHLTVSGCVRADLTVGDEIKLQFTGSSTNTNLEAQDGYLDHSDSARICLARIR